MANVSRETFLARKQAVNKIWQLFHVKHFLSYNCSIEKGETLDLQHYGLEIPENERELLHKHLEYVLEYNKKVQLTAISDYDRGLLLHVVDSLKALALIRDETAGPALDIGSGGGFPGIPLSVCGRRPFDLLDSVKKKMRGIEMFLQDEKLDDRIKTIDIRAEELAAERPSYYQLITARAVSNLPSLLELASPLLKNGGVFIAYKGKPEEEELARAHKVAKLVGMKLDRIENYLLEEDDHHRCLLVYRKVGQSKIKLPRRTGLAQKSPLA